MIKVKDQKASEPSSGLDSDTGEEGEEEVKGPSQATTSTVAGTTAAKKTTKAATSSAKGWTTKTVVTRSGAGCRFHATRPIRQRLILHQPLEPPNVEPVRMFSHPYHPNQDPDPELGHPFISQTTLLHCVAFRKHDPSHQARRDGSHPTHDHTPSCATPRSRKKHDQPPQCTVRSDDSESTPHYEEAGPSYAPPPFDERNAPPPFQEPSSSNLTRLPTFLEAECEIYAPA